MRAIGTLNLNFGLINITFKVNSFLETNDLSLRQLCPKCKSPISYKRFCGTCQKEVEYSQLLSGFEISKDNIVVVDKKALSFECQTKIIAIVDIDSEYEFMPKKFYLLTPKDVEKPYFLLLNILTKTNKEIVIEFSLRKKIHLGIIKPVVVNGYRFLMLKTIIYSDSIRDISPLKECEIGEDELNLGL
jgi:DNA end-binding protein Ku